MTTTQTICRRCCEIIDSPWEDGMDEECDAGFCPVACFILWCDDMPNEDCMLALEHLILSQEFSIEEGG